MQTLVYGPTLQATGAFDGGKITEQKPIGFSGEGAVVKRVSTLFYWAWAHAKQDGYIPLHPHQAFEIMTYVVAGKAEHGDTLGTKSSIGAGGVQLMQTGSGVSHEERFVGPDMEGFQIWFEPSVQEALQTEPTYNQYEHEAFPIEQGSGFTKKTVIGEGSPIHIVADARMWDVEIEPGASYSHPVENGRSLTALAIRGGGSWSYAGQPDNRTAFKHKDFVLVRAERSDAAVITADVETKLRLILIDVPTSVDYPLYPKR
ncbi:pirin family protein [Paenibacillus sacheonensis]|uniref:Pirin n=1 Tax=Paenibacillus sacheonensis TaxID=742054 RepID=A0A7X5BXN1_9BACL|nr:pirin family protein [Paenibacillus sacheonensis]MBM7568231.1 redox-sensitive bicupin YhaK (pirin superfamily) [Paenibacillus sacheonensis]NBC68581.1 pirin [Paenibacillus sacheonensis]